MRVCGQAVVKDFAPEFDGKGFKARSRGHGRVEGSGGQSHGWGEHLYRRMFELWRHRSFQCKKGASLKGESQLRTNRGRVFLKVLE